MSKVSVVAALAHQSVGLEVRHPRLRVPDWRRRAGVHAVANTNELAHTDRADLIDAVVEATEELFDDGDVSPSVAGTFATDLFDYGIVDVEATEQKLARKAEETVDHELSKNNGQVEIETMHEELERFPERIWRHRVQNRLRRGELHRRTGYYLSV